MNAAEDAAGGVLLGAGPVAVHEVSGGGLLECGARVCEACGEGGGAGGVGFVGGEFFFDPGEGVVEGVEAGVGSGGVFDLDGEVLLGCPS